MKILNNLRVTPEQADALQKQKAVAEKFGDVLAQELSQAQGVASTVGETGIQQSSFNAMSMVGASPSQLAESLNLSLQETSLQVESLFADMENYAAELRSDQTGGLRNAYSVLESMSGNIARLKETTPDLAKSPELASLIN